jgi:hypothetical protein
LDSKTVWLRWVSAWRVFAEVERALSGCAVTPLVAKGLVTGRVLYDGLPARLGDIDVFLRPRDLARAGRCAQRMGWPDVARHAPVLGQAVWKVDGWEVDVHSALGVPGLCATSVDEVIARAERTSEPFGVPHIEPETNDHALLLVLNAFKDGLRPMPWALEDLRRIVRHPKFDEAVFVSRAVAGRVATATWLVADWLAETHREAAWGAVRDSIGRRPPNRRVAACFDLWRRRRTPPRVGLFVVASSSDRLRRCVLGLGVAAAGVARGRGRRAVDAVMGGKR